MKKQLLLLLILCYSISGWGQISEYLDSNNLPVELGNADNPGFVELNNKFYFIGNNSTDVLYSIDTNSNLVTEFDTAGLVGANSLESLTIFNGQLYFVASNNGDINTKRLYLLLGNNAAQLTSNNVIVTGYDEMLVWDGELYFSGKLNSASDNALLKYDGNNFIIVNSVTPGVDFDPKRLTLNLGNNSLFFFTRVSDFGASEALWRLNIARKNAGNTTILQVGAVDFIDFFSSPPPLTEFANRIYTIGRTENDSEGFLYQAIGTTLSRVNNATGYSPGSFHDIQTNNGGTLYNNKLAIFRSSNPGTFINDKLILLSANNSTQEFDLPSNANGQQFYNELNDALIFFAIDQNGSSIEYLYEFRENTIIDVLPEIRVIHDYLNSQSQRPYYGNIFNGKFYFYGASVNDINRRVLHEYDPEILNYAPFVDNQEELNYLGSLGYKNILGQLNIQDGTAIKGGTVINSLTPLADLEEIRYLLIDGVDIVDLNGLGSLNRVYDFFEVFQNSELLSLDGLNTNLIFDSASPDINNNVLLSNFCALQPWAVNNPGFSGTFATSGNAYNPTFAELQNTTACKASPCQTDIVLGSQEDVDTLIAEITADGCNIFEGAKLTVNNNAGGTRITDLSGLSVITSSVQTSEISISNTNLLSLNGIEGFLGNANISISISGNESLNDISALSSISTVLSLEIFETNLSDLSGVSNLETVTDIFYILGNTNLTSLNGLENLLNLNNNLIIENNANLINYCALQPRAAANTAFANALTILNNGYNPTIAEVQNSNTCSFTCTPVVFADANLKAFFLDPGNSSRILDGNGNPVTGLVIGGEVCAEKAIEVFEINLDGGYNNAPINSLGGLEEFTNLAELRMVNAQLSGDIDLRPLTSLVIFNADENAITSVTVSEVNSVLRRISIFEQGAGNTLTAVNLGGTMPALNSLDISTNGNLNAIDLTRTPLLDTFQSFATGITRLDFTALQSAGTGNFFISDTNGTLQEIDLRNNNPSFVLADFELDATGHPNLSCVLVNASDLATAQNNVQNSTWQFDNTDVVGTVCATCTPVNFADANLKAFFLDPGNSSRILDGNGNSVTGLVIGGEVCAEKAIEVFEINLDGGYNNAPITSLGGLEEFTNLGRLNIGGAQLTGSVDLSTLMNLEEFEGTGNEITALTASSANTKLTRIEVSFQGTNEDVLTAVNLNGASIPLLESLSLQNNRNLTSIDLTKTPSLASFRPDNTAISRLDLTLIDDLDQLDTFYLKDDENDGSLQEIDLRNGLGNFNVADFELDATGHPNLSCVLVNASDLATAQNNVQNSTWQFDNTDVVGTVCATCTPVNFADANLKAFFLDPGNSSRILDGNGNPVTGLVIGGEVCAEKAIEVFEINLDGGYNNAPITSLGGLEEFTNLGRLNIGGAQLTGSVDLSTLMNLEEFEGTGNEITALTASSANTKLTRIEVSFQGTNEDVLTAVNLNGASIPLLESLSLQNNRNLTSIDLTKTPSLASFRPDNTAISRLDLTLVDDLDQLDTFYLKDDENDGSLQEIDLRNGLGNFNVANFVLDATGHPNLSCVLVNASDLATAQNNVQNSTWQFDNTDVVKTVCDPSGPYEVEVYIDVDDAQQDGSGTYTYFHDEDSANQIALNFNLVGATSTEVAQYQINITTRGNTADNGLDYEARSGIITLTTVDGSDTNDLETQLIQILWDNNIEDVESFYIDITPADNSIVLKDFTNGLGTTLGIGETLTFEVFVRDNDVPEVRIATTDDIATEDGPTNAEFSIGLFEPSSNTTLFNETGSVISINYSTSGTAIAGTDYTSLPGVFEIPEGESSAGLIIFALDDDLQDGNKELTVTLSGTNVGNIATGSNALAMITFVDNDSGDPDADNDGITDSLDNCPTLSNPDQADLDGDNQGDVCDEDDDGDGVNDGEDAFPRDISESSDNDNDGLGDNADTDDDNDGVLDVNDDCQYVSGPPAENGCPEEIISFDQEAIQLVVLGETCEGENNGSFEVTIDNEDHTFTINLDGNVVGTASLNNPFEQNNLANGSYQVCLTVPELPDYEQCFGVVVSTYERLAVDANGIDATNLKASFSVQGSKNYEVSVNEKFYNFKFETTSNKILEIPVDKGQNIVSITGESDCQGIFKDVIVIGNVTIFPNPVKDILNFRGFTSEGQAQLNVFALSGSLVKSTKEQLENGGIMIHIPDLPKGIYLVKVISEIEVIEFKIIKE